MSVLDNSKHELFAQAMAEGRSAADAYVAAGYSPSRSAASRLSTNVNIGARVKELQAKAAQRALVTIESIAEELEAARLVAMNEDRPNPSAAVAASMGKAKLFVLL